MRVLMYAKYLPPRFSGAGRQAVTLARELMQRGVELRLVTERTPELHVPYELDGVVVHPVLPAARNTSPRARTCALVAMEAWRYGAAVFHAHSAFPEASAMGAAVRPLGVASLLKATLHRADLDCSTRIIGRLHRVLLRRQSGIVAISSEIAAELEDLGIRADRILRIPNGVDTSRFRPASGEERARARALLGIAASTRVVLFVGMLSQRKNADWLLDQWRAWRASADGLGDSLLLLVGPPSSDDAGNTQARVTRLTADPTAGVRWLGAAERMEEVYAAADLVVLPSLAEGMPNVLLEAMACGLPSAAADSSGCRDLLQGSPPPGWLFAPGDGGTLRACLADLGAAERLGQMGAAARRRAETHFSIPVIAEQYEDAYRRITGRAVVGRAEPSSRGRRRMIGHGQAADVARNRESEAGLPSRVATHRRMKAIPFFQSEDDRQPVRSRLLLISYHFPPSRAAGALRWQKLARYAADFGWGIDVVTLDPSDVGTADQETLADLPPGTRVFGVRNVLAPWDHVEHGAWKVYKSLQPAHRHMSAPRNSEELRPESFARGELAHFPRTWPDWRRAYQAYTRIWGEGAWARRAASLSLSLADPAVHRAVVTCGPPHMVHEAGRLVSNRTGLAFIMDLRDPWADVERLHEAIASPVWYWIGKKHEARCVLAAALVVMNTDHARAAMATRYPSLAGKMITVTNGGDDEPLRQGPAGGPFRVMYAGSVYLDRDPRPLLRAAAAVVRDLRLDPSQFSVDFIGDGASYCGVPIASLAAAEGISAYVRQHGHLPRGRLVEVLSDAAVLVTLPQDSHMAIPSKVFEYARFPAWLLAFAAPESATATLLQGTGADVVRPGDVDGAALVLRRRCLEHRAGVRPEPIASQARFTRRYQAQILFGALDRLLGRGGSMRPCAAGVP